MCSSLKKNISFFSRKPLTFRKRHPVISFTGIVGSGLPDGTGKGRSDPFPGTFHPRKTRLWKMKKRLLRKGVPPASPPRGRKRDDILKREPFQDMPSIPPPGGREDRRNSEEREPFFEGEPEFRLPFGSGRSPTGESAARSGIISRRRGPAPPF